VREIAANFIGEILEKVYSMFNHYFAPIGDVTHCCF